MGQKKARQRQRRDTPPRAEVERAEAGCGAASHSQLRLNTTQLISSFSRRDTENQKDYTVYIIFVQGQSLSEVTQFGSVES